MAQTAPISRRHKLMQQLRTGNVAERVVALLYFLLLLLAGLALLIVLAVLYFIFIFDWNHASGLIGEKASAAAGRDVVVKELAIDWGWPLTHVTVTGLSVANVAGATEPQMVNLDMLDATIDVRDFIVHFGRVNLLELTLTKPHIVLEKDKDGNSNWNLGTNPAGAAVTVAAPDDRTEVPLIGKLTVKEGALIYRDAKKKTDVTLKADTATGSTSGKDEITLDGAGNYQGQAMKIKLVGGNIMALKENTEPYPVDVSFVAGKTSISAKGTVDDPIKLAGLNLAVTVRGDNAADLFPLTGIALPTTPPYSIKGQLGLETESDKPKIWKFSNFNGRVGESDISGDLSFDVSHKRPLFKAKFVSKLLDFKDLGGLIGAKGTSDVASPEQKQEAATQKAAPTIIPDVPLDISRLSAMDAQVEFTGQQIQSGGLPLDNFYMKLSLDDSLLKADSLRFGTASGDISVMLTVNARQEPVRIDSDFLFRKLDLARLMEGLSKTLGQQNVSKGYIGGRAVLSGTGKSLHDMLSTSNGTLGIGMAGGQLSNLVVELVGLDIAEGLGFYLGGDAPTPIRCVIANFDVKDGLATTNTFVIDTKDTNIHGKGTLNFKDEAMNMILRPQPKDVSLVSLRSPISVTGTLKNPSVGVEGSLVRAGAAGALGVLVPFAAIAALVETGLGDDSNCGALLDDMKKETGQQGGKSLVPTNPQPAPMKE